MNNIIIISTIIIVVILILLFSNKFSNNISNNISNNLSKKFSHYFEEPNSQIDQPEFIEINDGIMKIKLLEPINKSSFEELTVSELNDYLKEGKNIEIYLPDDFKWHIDFVPKILIKHTESNKYYVPEELHLIKIYNTNEYQIVIEEPENQELNNQILFVKSIF